jgi:hypothetical protein
MSCQKISPKYDTSKLSLPTLENYIDVYEDQINGWYLNYARKMHNDEHAGFAALQIVFSYFEGHAVFYKGMDSAGKSKAFFKEAFLSVFPELLEYEGMSEALLESTISALYEDGRCGLFHAGITRKRILLRDGQPVIRVGADPVTQMCALQVFIDRRNFVDRVCKHFEKYIARLRNTSEARLRMNFEKALILLHGPIIFVK